VTPGGGRRRADDHRDEALAAPPVATPGPPSDGALTMPRTSRADRRREGLLPSGEDPMLRRPPPRPTGGLPPGGGRRRTDGDPLAAPGRPPATGERRRPVVPAQPLTQAQSPAVPARPPLAPAAQRPAPAVPRPTPGPASSGPMTTAAPMTAAAPSAGRGLPPAGRPENTDVPLHRATAAGAPPTTGMPSWAAEPATPPVHDVTQRVSGIPADSAWGPQVAAAPVEVTRAPQTPPRPLRSGPPSTPPAAAPAAPAAVDSPMTAEHPAPEPAEPVDEPARRRVDVPVGGRAAARLERQAAEAAQKKSRRGGPAAKPEGPGQSGTATTGPGRDPEPQRASRGPQRLVQGLVAVVVVAVGVLGFWSFTSPNAEETAAQSPVPSTTASTTSAAAPPVQESVAPSPEVVPSAVGPVRAPITVLNSTNITGLAGDIGDQLTDGGWEVTGTDQSPVEDVATTTVYYTAGDTTQQQAATQLVEQFPDVSGPVPRYFDVPDQPAPGLVVVATGNWRP
jgi:hypothetical protein